MRQRLCMASGIRDAIARDRNSGSKLLCGEMTRTLLTISSCCGVGFLLARVSGQQSKANGTVEFEDSPAFSMEPS